jgi:hypothetical protein
MKNILLFHEIIPHNFFTGEHSQFVYSKNVVKNLKKKKEYLKNGTF